MLYTTIAKPYAKALFSLAAKKHEEAKWLAALADLAVVAENPDFQLALNNPKVDIKQIFVIIRAILKQDVAPEIINLLPVLAQNKRLMLLAEIYEGFNRLVLENQQRAEAVIESAYALNEGDQRELEKILSKKLGLIITSQVIINPKLMAGIRITVNDKVIDKSIEGRLNNMATSLL